MPGALLQEALTHNKTAASLTDYATSVVESPILSKQAMVSPVVNVSDGPSIHATHQTCCPRSRHCCTSAHTP